MFTSARALTILFVGLGFAVTAQGATYSYRLTRVPLNEGPWLSHGRAIGNGGHITGRDRVCNSERCFDAAFLWGGNPSGTSSLTHLSAEPFGENSFGTDVNDLGQVTGRFYNSEPDGTLESAFFWDGATIKLLGALGGNFSLGTAINKHGHITGYANLAGNASHHAFVWDGTTMRDLGTLGGSNSNSEGQGINTAGHVTGCSERSDGQTRAFLWDGSVMKSLGTLGGTYSCAAAINNKDQVVGASTIKDSELHHAFLWQNGLMEDLGIWPFRQFAVARAMNNSGQIVGNSGEILFLWENGVMQDVTTFIAANDPYWNSGFELRGVFDINNVGQMLGTAVSEDFPDILRTYLMSPAYKLSAFLKPTLNTWKRGSTVRIAIAVLDDNRVRIPDQRAQALQAVSCRVKVSATGAQSLAPTCMNYDATTNEFWFEWQLLGTGTGTATIDARVNYGAPGPLKVLKTKNITVTT